MTTPMTGARLTEVLLLVLALLLITPVAIGLALHERWWVEPRRRRAEQLVREATRVHDLTAIEELLAHAGYYREVGGD